MKAVKKSGNGKGVLVGRDGASGRFTDGINVPGMGNFRVVRGDTIATAKAAAGTRLRVAISNTGGWKPSK